MYKRFSLCINKRGSADNARVVTERGGQNFRNGRAFIAVFVFGAIIGDFIGKIFALRADSSAQNESLRSENIKQTHYGVG